ncbi:MAG: PAS domain-containing protein, partial [Acidimicrobiales bacterium]
MQGAARDGAARPHELRAGLIAGLIVFAVVFVAYGAGAELAWRVFAADIGLAFFPPAGVTVAALALLPRRRWWAVFAAIVAAEIAVDLEHGLSLGLAIGYSAANCVEPLVGVSVLRRLSPGRLDLGRRRGAVSFIVAAVGAGAGAGAVVGGLVKVVQSAVPWWNAALHWWAGDGLGILAIGVAIISCREVRLPAGRRLLEPVLCLAAVLAASIVAFWESSTPPAFLLLPVLVWAALRLGPRGVSVCSAVMAIVANAATARGRGPFAVLDVSAQAQLGYAQLFLGSVIITVWFLAIETTERAEASAERELERAAKERAESAAATGALSAALVRQASIDDIAAVVDGHLRRHFDTALAVIVLYDSSTGAFWAPASLPAPARDASAGWTLDTPAPGPAALAGGEAVWVGSRRELLERFPAMGAVATPLELGALGALPMQLEGRPLGYLGVARNVDRPFTPTERGELAVISGIVAQALDRTELYEAERRSRLDAQAAYGEVQKLLRRAAYEANLLRESEQRFQLLADQSPLLIWVHDAAGEQQWVNQTFCDFFGIDRADAGHGRWPDLLHPADAAGYLAELADALEQRRPFHAEARVRGTNGDWRWIESWGQPRFGPEGEFAGHVGGSADVTDRRLAEQELAAAHQFVQEVTALAPGVIAVLDLDLGRNVFVSRRSFEVLRDEPDEPVALGEASLPSVLHPDDQERVKANLAAARALGHGETMAVDYRLRRRDGSWRWFRSTATPLRRDLGGVVSQVATLTIDITDQKAHEAQVQAAAALDAFRARLADALVGVTDLAEIQGRAARLLVDQLGAAGACFVEPHEPAARRTAPIGWPPPPPEDGPRYETLARAATQGGGPLVIDNDAAADARLALDALGNGACVVQALPAGHRPCALVVRRGQPHLWAESELALVAETAERTGAALRRAQTERDQQRRRTQAELLARVLAELEDQADPAAAMQHLAEALVPELADSATVVQSAPRRDVLGFAHRGRARPSADSAPHSHAAAALDLGDGARASLFVGLSDPARDPFTGEDRAFLADLAQRVGVVVAAAQVRRAEHDIAVTLQNALLPDRVCWDAAVAVEARYQAASGV